MSTGLRKLLFLGVALVSLFAASLQVEPLVETRQRFDLTSDPVEGVSPQLVMATQMFGWARGIMIDVIWIRMEELKQAGRFFELAQLADWACKLAPRIDDVWDVQAWNMAYNVSCLVDYFPDRWEWVWSGIKLLRDEAIPNNPNSYDLYWHLSWTIYHKLGQDADNAHFFYKERFALLMQDVLGGSGDWPTLVALEKAPRSREDLLQDEDVRELVAECARIDGFDIVTRFFEWYHGTDLVTDRVRDILAVKDAADAVPEAVHDLLDPLLDKDVSDHRLELRIAALAKIELYARARRLREEFKMYPRRMIDVVDRYFRTDPHVAPPVDWRSPFPHAVYWAMLGMEKLQQAKARDRRRREEYGLRPRFARYAGEAYTDESEDIFEYSSTLLQRVVYLAMQSLVQHGRLLFDTAGGFLYEVGPEYRLADAVIPTFEAVLRSPEEGGTFGTRARKGTRDAYMHFLERGVAEFSFMGMKKKSEQYYELLKAWFPDRVAGRTYEEYVEWRVLDYESSMTFAAARNRLRGLFVNAWFYYGAYDDEMASRYEQRADLFAKVYDEREKEWRLRGLLRDKVIKDTTLVDILAGVFPFPDNVRRALLNRLQEEMGEETFRKLMANVEHAKTRRNIERPELLRDRDLLREHRFPQPVQ